MYVYVSPSLSVCKWTTGRMTHYTHTYAHPTHQQHHAALAPRQDLLRLQRVLRAGEDPAGALREALRLLGGDHLVDGALGQLPLQKGEDLGAGPFVLCCGCVGLGIFW